MSDREVSVAPLSDDLTVALGGHYVVELARPLNAMQASRLRAVVGAGLTWLPDNFLLVRGADIERLRTANLDFIRGFAPYRPEWKLDPNIGGRLVEFEQPERKNLEEAGQLRLIVTLFADAQTDAAIRDCQALGATVLDEVDVAGQTLLDLVVTDAALDALIGNENIQYVEEAPEITLRSSTVRWIVQTNQLNVTPLYAAGLHGEGEIIAVLDSQIDMNHCSFRDDVNPVGPDHRKILAYNAPQGAASHGTLVAGIAAGDAGDDGDTRGVAYGAKLVFHTAPFGDEVAVAARLQLHHDQGARIHTNSWGDDGTTAYNGFCRVLDQFAYDNEDDLLIFAVTNLFALRNPENAKNILAVGATSDAPNQANHCSGGTGPTIDARRKPEIFAPGCGILAARWNTECAVMVDSGTSMATPAVAGIAALIRQYFVQGYYPTGTANPADNRTPSAALLKAALIDSAADMTGVAGYPSHREGWGRLTADNVLYFPGDARRLVVHDVRNADGLATGDVRNYSVLVDSDIEPLRITLAWTEPPAAAGVFAAQVNNLDLEVISPQGVKYLGNVFSAGASTVGGAPDERNNVEQAHFSTPPSGRWLVRVRGAAVNQATQGFALVITGAVTDDSPPVLISLPNGAPMAASVNADSTFQVEITPGAESLALNGARLHYRIDGGDFLTAPLVHSADSLYEGTLPGGLCNQPVQFYISAEAESGATRTLPDAAPESFFIVPRGEFQVLFADDFETDLGWTVLNSPSLVTGAWERAVPNGGGTRGDSPADYDGSGACYLTQNGPGDLDIDGGATWLISPAIDLSSGDAVLHFAAWMSNHFGMAPNEDAFFMYLSNDDGNTWTQAYMLGPDSSGQWNPVSIRISDYLTPTAQMRIRFEASDQFQTSVVEAAVDAVLVQKLVCTDPPPPVFPADMNCDGVVSVADIAGFVLAVTDAAGYATAFPDCNLANADMNNDGMITVSDIGPFVQVLTGGD